MTQGNRRRMAPSSHVDSRSGEIGAAFKPDFEGNALLPGRDRGASGKAGDQGSGVFSGCLSRSTTHGAGLAGFVALNRRLLGGSSPSSVLALPVSLSPKLCVTRADTEHTPFYLRTFFRVLSSWVHRGEIVE